jgi:tRNA pseudouridine38-40 synthase
VRLALIIEYDGSRYSGFQYQTNAPSVQAELEDAIERLTGERVRIAGAGRTDAGVHAAGQVVAFDTGSELSAERFIAGMNFHLPKDVAVRSAHRVPEGFDPRRAAESRWYRYTLLNRATRSPLAERSAVVVKQPLDIGSMRTAAELMVGTHDFARFAGPLERPEASTVRAVNKIDINVDGEKINIDVEGSSFLPHQVRRMVGALVDVGRGKMTAADVASLVAGQDTGAVAHSVPPQGLSLVQVRYPMQLGLGPDAPDNAAANKTIG